MKFSTAHLAGELADIARTKRKHKLPAFVGRQAGHMQKTLYETVKQMGFYEMLPALVISLMGKNYI